MRLPLLVLVFTLFASAFSFAAEKVTDLRLGQSGWVSFPSTQDPVQLVGRLDLPEGDGKVPAMIIAHASGGMDQRNERWAQFLRANGMATFVLDYFGPRGVYAESASQPTPTKDLLDTLQLLSTHPRIDPARIGVIGFSRGANMAMEAASMTARDGTALAASVALYPSCWNVNFKREPSQVRVLLLAAGKDDLVPVAQCEVLAERGRDLGRDVTLKVYENACHGWDGDANIVWFHRAVNRSYTMCTDARITKESQQDVLAFLKNVFKL